MSTKVTCTCDRCGKEFGANLFGPVIVRRVVYTASDVFSCQGLGERRVDLCPRCHKEFRTWVRRP